jgi:peptidoglycan/LPS O-acetylase OafA/YrhL
MLSELNDQTNHDRAKQSRNYVAALTGLRGVAALFVFVFHYGSLNPGIRLDLSVPLIGAALQFPLGLGFAGVDLFFVLSGFLLTLPFANTALSNAHQPSLGTYYKRRLLRVFPAYYAQLAIILVFGAWFVTWKPVSGTSLLAHLGMFFNIGGNPVRPIVGIWWTLPVELSFYLLLPLIALFLRPAKWLILLIPCILLSVLYRLWSADHFAAASAGGVYLAASHLPGSLPEFLLGATAALLVQWFNVHAIKKPSPAVLDGLFLAGSALAVYWLWGILRPNGSVYWSGHWSMIVAPIALGLPLSVMVISLYWGSRIGQMLFANPVIYFLGLISYSFYLWHFVVMQQAGVVFGEGWSNLSQTFRFLSSLSLVIMVSTLSYYLFERPFFRLGHKRKTRRADQTIKYHIS